jgi:phosphatidylserine/phosphatidylglycerophosphate/cardiolipin synthase-like enzyme
MGTETIKITPETNNYVGVEMRAIKQLLPILLCLVILCGCQHQGSPTGATTAPSGAASTSCPTTNLSVYFSPKGGCTEAVVKALDAAKLTIGVQAYSFTSAPIAKALVDAHKRGVVVVVILDKSQRTEKYSEADFLAHAGITVWIDDQHKIAHNKVMIIDMETVITGSFNFTKAAEEGNAENLLVIASPDLAKRYYANFMLHREHSERLLIGRELTGN